jgi:DNA-binding GntR family transcriptional regulator
MTLRGNLHRSVTEHRAILRALQRGDADRAVHLMSEHIRVPQRNLALSADGEPGAGAPSEERP